jgi:hypothetical protein
MAGSRVQRCYNENPFIFALGATRKPNSGPKQEHRETGGRLSGASNGRESLKNKEKNTNREDREVIERLSERESTAREC